MFCTATQAWRHKFAKIANEYPSFTFAVADEEENSDLFHDFGFDESGEEVNVGILGPKDRRYPMEPMEEFESDEVTRFLMTYMKGVLTVCSMFSLVTSAFTSKICCICSSTLVLVAYIMVIYYVLLQCLDTFSWVPINNFLQ